MDAAPKAPKQGVMSVAFRTKDDLLAAYMPYVKNGGLFVSTEKPFDLGDEVFVLLSLMDDPERYPVTGKVVWITPRGALSNRPMGVGLQFNGQDSVQVHKKIETFLAGTAATDKPTHTM